MTMEKIKEFKKYEDLNNFVGNYYPKKISSYEIEIIKLRDDIVVESEYRNIQDSVLVKEKVVYVLRYHEKIPEVGI